MKISSALLKVIALSSFIATASHAAIIDDITSALAPGDPIQNGRLSRTGVPSDWSTVKPFPGTINSAISYHYHEYDLVVGALNYLQVDFFNINNDVNDFVSAYLGSYDPAHQGVHYLGDIGSSGNLAGNPAAFQIIGTPGTTVVFLVNDASGAGAGVGNPFELIVEGFYDTSFNDTVPPVPEPATWGMMAAGIGFAGLFARRIRKA